MINFNLFYPPVPIINLHNIEYDPTTGDLSHINYTLSYPPLRTRCKEVAKEVFQSIYQAKWPIILSTAVGMAMVPFLARRLGLPDVSFVKRFSLGLIGGGNAYLTALALDQYVKNKHLSIAGHKLELSLLEKEKYHYFYALFKDFIQTPTGQGWLTALSSQNLTQQQVFKRLFISILRGHCFGYSKALIEALSDHPHASDEDLIKAVDWKHVIHYQFLEVLGSRSVWVGIHADQFDKQLANSIEQAQYEAFNKKLVISSSFAELYPKYNKVTSPGDLRTKADLNFVYQSIQKYIKELENQYPSKIIAGTLTLSYADNLGFGHMIFIQFNRKHYRFCDNYIGLYAFSTQNQLIAGLCQYIEEQKLPIKSVCLDSYLINHS